MFAAVIETGSFAAAAMRLGTSTGQPSKLVSRLERELGVQLIMRTTRALALSEVGRAYYERIKGIIEDLESLDASVRNASGTPSGRLRITAPVTFGTTQLTPVLITFAPAFPNIQSAGLVDLPERSFCSRSALSLILQFGRHAKRLAEVLLV